MYTFTLTYKNEVKFTHNGSIQECLSTMSDTILECDKTEHVSYDLSKDRMYLEMKHQNDPNTLYAEIKPLK